jgi:hypothetical protein
MTSMQGCEPPHLTRMGGWHVMPQAADLFPLAFISHATIRSAGTMVDQSLNFWLRQ